MLVNKKCADSSGARECQLGLRIAIFNSGQSSRSESKIYGYFRSGGGISASAKMETSLAEKKEEELLVWKSKRKEF